MLKLALSKSYNGAVLVDKYCSSRITKLVGGSLKINLVTNLY